MPNAKYKKRDINALIIMSQQNDQKALEELIRRVQKNVFTMFSYLTTKKQDIADLTQDALVKMARNIKSLKDTTKFKQWLNQIVTNVFYDYLKKHANDKNIDPDNDKIMELKDKLGCEPGEKCLFSEMEKLIKTAILNLPDTLRIAIILREYEGLSYDDISRITNAAIGTVKSRIARARVRLQQELKEFI